LASSVEFRIDRDDEAFKTFLDEITEQSGEMCEVCGEAGTEQIANRWISTLCGRHFVERTAGADSGGSDGASW